MNKITLTLAPNQSTTEWEAIYLQALSYLNFDYHLSLLIMPNAQCSCTWNEKQWKALSLYGLNACFHLKEAPPIESVLVDWTTARKLFIRTGENLLHICHWHNPAHFKTWQPFAADDDSLLLLGPTDEIDTSMVVEYWPNHSIYIVKLHDTPHIGHQGIETIDHLQWKNLIQQHPATLSWK